MNAYMCIMITYYFRDSYFGFFDWLKTINKIKIRYLLLCQNSGCGIIKRKYDDFKTLKRHYILYLKYLLELNTIEREFVKEYSNHHIPSKEIRDQVDIDYLYRKWKMVVLNGPVVPNIRRLTNKEVGDAIKEARLIMCKSRKEVADILHIQEETLKSYELGKTKLPFTVFYQLSQIFEINIK